MKKWLEKAAALLLSAVMMVSGLPLITSLTDITAFATEEKWDSFYSYLLNASTISIDENTFYGDSGYSIKITNTDYNDAAAKMTLAVKKNTHYRASVMAKCSGYELDPTKLKDSGAAIGNAECKIDEQYTGTAWKRIYYEFDSEDNTEYTIALYNGLWGVGCKGTVWFSDFKLEEYDRPWDSFYSYHRNASTISIDETTFYGDSGYSIKITNTDYNDAAAKMTLAVKKNTHYRASVMAKCSGYELDPTKLKDSGAAIGNAECKTDEQYTGTAWKRIYYEFDSGDSTEYTIALYNGLWGVDCKGTVWFSDFRLEESTDKPSNRWNVLAVVFKNVEVPVEIDGKEFIYNATLNNSDVKLVGNILSNLYTSIPILSDGLWGFNSIEVVSTDAVVNELVTYDNDIHNIHGFRLEPTSDCISKELDKFIDKAEKESGKKYDLIIAVASLSNEVTGGWAGLGANQYRGINFCQVTYISGTPWYDSTDGSNFQESVFVHEILHCVERISRDELKSPTQNLHANEDVYGQEYYQYNIFQNGWFGNGTYYSDYIRGQTPDIEGIDSNGVDQRAFLSYRNSTYKVIYGSEPAYPKTDVAYPKTDVAYPKTDVSKLTISKPKDYTYTGKAIKPELTVKDGTKTLVKDTDYTLTYVNNTDAGYAAVIVNGKGKYSGKYAQNFIIKPKKTTLTVTKNSNRYTFSWKEGTSANKYQIYYSTDGGKKYKLLKTIDGEMNSTTIKLDTSKNYRFKIRSVKELYPKKFYSSYSAVVTAKTATAKNSNETFKYGKLYVITSKNSGLAMDIANSSKNNGGNLIQYTYSGKKSQKWYLEQQSNGYYVIKNYNSGKVIDVDKNGNAVQQKYTGGESQQWLIKKVGKFYKIINHESFKALDVYAFNKSDGASIVQWIYGGNDNQHWSISLA